MTKSVWALEKEIVEHMCEIQEQDPMGWLMGRVCNITAGGCDQNIGNIVGYLACQKESDT